MKCDGGGSYWPINNEPHLHLTSDLGLSRTIPLSMKYHHESANAKQGAPMEEISCRTPRRTFGQFAALQTSRSLQQLDDYRANHNSRTPMACINSPNAIDHTQTRPSSARKSKHFKDTEPPLDPTSTLIIGFIGSQNSKAADQAQTVS